MDLRGENVLWWRAPQVAYPGDNVSVAVTVVRGRIPVPAAVAYVLAPLTYAAEPFLPGVGGVVTGTLSWDPAEGGQLIVPVPIEWSQVSLSLIMPPIFYIPCFMTN